VFPYVVAAPTYFSEMNVNAARDCLIGNAAQGGAAVNACYEANDVFAFGHLNQLSSAFGRVQDCLSWFIQAYPALASFKATTDRLGGFVEDIETSEAEVELIREGKAEGFRTHLQGEDRKGGVPTTEHNRPVTKGPKPKI
jgi:ABC-type uncharacterized transport system fused permease/ATPase subunit